MPKPNKTKSGLFYKEDEYNGYPTFAVSNNAEFNNERRGDDKALSYGMKKLQMLYDPEIVKAAQAYIKSGSGAKLPSIKGAATSNGARRVVSGGARRRA